MNEYLDLINKKLEEYTANLENKALQEAIEYALFSGGKRLRPLLLLSVLADLDVDINLGIYPATALEMIHTYSLIHDDLPAMDDDDYRRGMPSLHKKYGEAMAILAADALLTDAFKAMLAAPLSANLLVELVRLASHYAGGNGMVNGQALDILSIHKKLNLSDLEAIYLNKTRALFALAVLTAAGIAEVDAATYADFEDFTYYFGLAFQIKDDLEDIQVSKERKSDLAADKATYPILIGVEPTKEILGEYKEKALAIIKRLLGEKATYQLVMRNI